jgi:photosystem II stability/assembly factor-like uncharacterized protein
MSSKLTAISICIVIASSITICLNAQPAPTPAAERIKSLEAKRQMAASSPFDSVFRNVGPAVMSGRVVDLDVNPADPTEFYVAYATGGLWHTTNNGQSFKPIFDSGLVIGLGAVAVHWPTRTIWLGTGEANSSRSSYSGIGIYKSTDSGKNWIYSGLPESHHIGRIILHPVDMLTAWVAVIGHLYTPNKERGIYKTSDGGKTWKKTLFIDENTGGIDLAINPNDPKELYANMWYRSRRAWNFEESGKTSNIYKSNDGGESWKLITGAGTGFPTGNGVGRTGVAIYPKNPSIVYAIVDNQDHLPDTATKKVDTLSYAKTDLQGLTKAQFATLDSKRLDTFLVRSQLAPKYSAASIKQMVFSDSLKPTALYDYFYDANEALFNTPIIGAEIYKSENGGQSWKKVNEKPLKLYNTYGYYFGKIFISPVNENKLIITGYNIDLSTDGGKTFKHIEKDNVHADHHACWINPSRDSHYIIGNDGGVNITYDNGDNWFKANTPAVGQFYGITTDNQKPYRVYGGLQDNGVWYGLTEGREVDDASFDTLHYASIISGDGMMAQVDTRDNKTVYSGFQFGYYSRVNTDTGGYFSIHPKNELGEAPYRFNWCTPILLSRHNQDIFYLGSNKLNQSLNKGVAIKPISPDLTNGGKKGDIPYGTITSISESPLRFGMLYAGTDDGNIQLSKDGGYSWKKISDNINAPGLWVSRVVASRFKEGRVYATLNGYRFDHFKPYVFVSEDYGAHWSAIASNLPMEPVNVIVEDPNKDSLLYVGTDGGLYVSKDRGSSWNAWTKGLPLSVPVHDITIQEREQEILLGTHGRSIYVSKLPTALSKPAPAKPKPVNEEVEIQ